MRRRWWLLVLGLALLLAAVSPLASRAPDGLERVAGEHGIAGRALAPAYRLIPDYLFPGVADESLATVISGVLGVLVVFGLVYGLASWLRRSRGRM